MGFLDDFRSTKRPEKWRVHLECIDEQLGDDGKIREDGKWLYDVFCKLRQLRFFPGRIHDEFSLCCSYCQLIIPRIMWFNGLMEQCLFQWFPVVILHFHDCGSGTFGRACFNPHTVSLCWTCHKWLLHELLCLDNLVMLFARNVQTWVFLFLMILSPKKQSHLAHYTVDGCWWKKSCNTWDV